MKINAEEMEAVPELGEDGKPEPLKEKKAVDLADLKSSKESYDAKKILEEVQAKFDNAEPEVPTPSYFFKNQDRKSWNQVNKVRSSTGNVAVG